MRTNSRQMALGGMMAAVAVVIMAMGSIIPVNTYVCPVLCILITRIVVDGCGRKLAWCYYLAVAILSMLLAPDREAALVYVCLGYYPLIRPWFAKIRPAFVEMVCKILFFTAAGAAAYGLLMTMMGLEALMAEFDGLGMAGLVILVVLWDVLFVLVDRLLGLPLKKRRK